MREQVDETSAVLREDFVENGRPDDVTGEEHLAGDEPVASSEPPDEVEREPLHEFTAAVAELADQVRAHHARAEAREKVIDHLHDEVQRLRVGEQGLLLRPVVTDLQALRGDLLRQAATLPEDIGSGQVSSLLASFALSVEQALERCGIVPVRPEVGDPFSAREHRALKVVDAESPDLDSTVDAVVSDGYLDTRADRVTVPARVHVRKWTDAPGSTAAHEGSDEDV